VSHFLLRDDKQKERAMAGDGFVVPHPVSGAGTGEPQVLRLRSGRQFLCLSGTWRQ